MIFLSFFKIPYRDRLAKYIKRQYVQVIPRSTMYQNDETKKCDGQT